MADNAWTAMGKPIPWPNGLIGVSNVHHTPDEDNLWTLIPDTVFSVAAHAVYTGDLDTAEDVLAFFEKPWHYPELHALWLEANAEVAS